MTFHGNNPVIAVLLGGLVSGEGVTSSMALGTALILIGVSRVFGKRSDQEGDDFKGTGEEGFAFV